MVERYHRTRGRHLGGAKRKQSEETKDDGQPGKTGENGRTTSGLGDKVEEDKIKNLRSLSKNCSLYRFEGPAMTRKRNQRKPSSHLENCTEKRRNE